MRPKRNENIANIRGEIASYIKSVVIQDDVKVQKLRLSSRSHILLIDDLFIRLVLLGKRILPLKPKMCLKMRMKRIIMIMQTLLLITLMMFFPVRIKFLDLLSGTFNHNCSFFFSTIKLSFLRCSAVHIVPYHASL